MRVVHVELSDANAYVELLHRHHKPVRGHRFSLGAENGGGMAGVVIVGRPVARKVDHTTTVEVLRLCTNGDKNVCSFLYSAAARAAKSLGYALIQTYILGSEPGTSLIASGWELVATTPGGDWNCKSRGGRRTDQPFDAKLRYAKSLA